MKVFLDTNVFYNNWFASNANFKLLFYFLNNENHHLLLSNLVVQETNNIRNKEVKELQSEFLGLVKKGSKLSQKKIEFAIDSLGFEPYDLIEILKSKLDCICNISYENIPHYTVVNRALKTVKPFSGQEKGYRDTLIWLSFLKYLKDNNIEGNVAFITNNKHDFFESNEKSLTFNSDLLKDINEHGIKTNIKPYLNIYDFVNDNVDKVTHSFDRHQILDDLENFLIEGTETYLNEMNNNDLSHLLRTKVFSDKLTSVINIESNILEGLEDPEINDVKSLTGTSIYISSYFEMRRVDLVISIEKIEFKQYADEIQAINSLYNIEIEDDYVKLSFIIRTCIDCSFEYETKDELASNLSIEYIFNHS